MVERTFSFRFDATVTPAMLQTAVASFPPVPGIRPSGVARIFEDGHLIQVGTELDLPNTPENAERARTIWQNTLTRTFASQARRTGLDSDSSGPEMKGEMDRIAGGASPGVYISGGLAAAGGAATSVGQTIARGVDWAASVPGKILNPVTSGIGGALATPLLFVAIAAGAVLVIFLLVRK
jgi:hypothetical protein